MAEEYASLITRHRATNWSAMTKASREPYALGPIGSRNDWLIYDPIGDEVSIGLLTLSGKPCWFGTLAEFEDRVEAIHGDTRYGVEYRAAIVFLRVLKGDN